MKMFEKIAVAFVFAILTWAVAFMWFVLIRVVGTLLLTVFEGHTVGMIMLFVATILLFVILQDIKDL